MITIQIGVGWDESLKLTVVKYFSDNFHFVIPLFGEHTGTIERDGTVP